jgi:cbb3-type cytochrome oxidase cytochrome c subunit
MRWRALLSLLALLWLFVLVAVGVGWGPFAPSRLPPAFSPPQHAVPRWIKIENLRPDAVAGTKLFSVAGCTACHTYAGSGTQLLKAPDLTAIGSRNLGIDFQIRHLKCPSCVVRDSPMPPFASLGVKRLRQLAIFLEASKGVH